MELGEQLDRELMQDRGGFRSGEDFEILRPLEKSFLGCEKIFRDRLQEKTYSNEKERELVAAVWEHTLFKPINEITESISNLGLYMRAAVIAEKKMFAAIRLTRTALVMKEAAILGLKQLVNPTKVSAEEVWAANQICIAWRMYSRKRDEASES